jgi:uncharacterized protein YbbK (DUF523 family)
MEVRMTRLRLRTDSPVLVSACLLGLFCRYDGRVVSDERVLALARDHLLIPVCPEQMGGLPTPRMAVEMRAGQALTRDGLDLTEMFERGVAQVVGVASLTGARTAILQPRSPSCGVGEIYDGTFSGRLVPGDGLLAAALRSRGLDLVLADELEASV